MPKVPGFLIPSAEGSRMMPRVPDHHIDHHIDQGRKKKEKKEKSHRHEEPPPRSPLVLCSSVSGLARLGRVRVRDRPSDRPRLRR